MLRPRREEDLGRCVALLREVYEADRHPVVWPADPFNWLSARDHLAAWVDEDDDRMLGHLSLARTDSSRARPQWDDAIGVPVDRLADRRQPVPPRPVASSVASRPR